jgi:hypothetical protein
VIQRYEDKLSFSQALTNQIPLEYQHNNLKLKPKLSYSEQVTDTFEIASDQVMAAKISPSVKKER